MGMISLRMGGSRIRDRQFFSFRIKRRKSRMGQEELHKLGYRIRRNIA